MQTKCEQQQAKKKKRVAYKICKASRWNESHLMNGNGKGSIHTIST